ncbi:methionine aminopeptidase, type I [Thermobaculum terrenum ATCC BAA-798]|uniref:Methionine aminopeptidase n=1 Tax=Thermobaculum terrenum (strain ATCC BAA-798 / CCMEE 7001 / YNP1) TaxID=525904 RepID=D1CFE8_THET1|nr:type I methionyl aminopeptidase [Thermobaculum terrenum]ACZ41654.1 methionine aminopeptidase, type I [Thermobaculum terrenum ATCC BAA-798]
MAIILKSKKEIDRMRRAGLVLRDLFDLLVPKIKPGVTTGELDAFIESYIRNQNCKPSFKNLYGFPASACISINEEVVHGIPSSRQLREGDLVKIDVGALYEGFHADASRTFWVGHASAAAKRLVSVTAKALDAGISKAVPGNRVGDISSAIQTVVESEGFSVVRDYVGHGVGRSLHEDPQVPNFGFPGQGPILRVGMTLAIEPMVNEGTHEVILAEDKWTVKTKDGKLSAQIEDTVAITEDGPFILTR